MVDFSTNQNAAKLEFSIENSANLLYLFIRVDILKLVPWGGGGGGVGKIVK